MSQLLLDRETQKHPEAPVFPMLFVSNPHWEDSVQRLLASLKFLWLSGSSPPKTATAVSSRAAEMEAQTPRLGDIVSHPLVRTIAVLQSSRLNRSSFSRHERQCLILLSSQMFLSHHCRLLLLLWVDASVCWETENRVRDLWADTPDMILLKTQCLIPLSCWWIFSFMALILYPMYCVYWDYQPWSCIHARRICHLISFLLTDQNQGIPKCLKSVLVQQHENLSIWISHTALKVVFSNVALDYSQKCREKNKNLQGYFTVGFLVVVTWVNTR